MAAALKSFAALLSQPQAQPEFRSLQVTNCVLPSSKYKWLVLSGEHSVVLPLGLFELSPTYLRRWACCHANDNWPLQVPKLRAVAVSQVAATLADTYELAYDCLLNPASGYETDAVAKADLQHSPKEIRTILGIL